MIFSLARLSLCASAAALLAAPGQRTAVTAEAYHSPDPSWVRSDTTGVADSNMMIVDIGPVAGHQLRDLLTAEAVKAKGRRLTPFVELGAPWCPSCQEMHALLAAKPIDPKVHDEFTGTYIIRLNTDQWKKGDQDPKWEGMRSALGITEEFRGIPVFFAIDSAGRVQGTMWGDEWGDNNAEGLVPLQKFFQKYSWQHHKG